MAQWVQWRNRIRVHTHTHTHIAAGPLFGKTSAPRLRVLALRGSRRSPGVSGRSLRTDAYFEGKSERQKLCLISKVFNEEGGLRLRICRAPPNEGACHRTFPHAAGTSRVFTEDVCIHVYTRPFTWDADVTHVAPFIRGDLEGQADRIVSGLCSI